MPAIDERARHDLFQAVHDQLGPNHADTLMSLLPPVGWADVATKHDLLDLETSVKHDLHEREARLDLRFKAVDREFEELEARLGHRFDAIDERFKGLDERFKVLDERFNGIDHKLEALGHQLTGKIDRAQTETVRTLIFGLLVALTSLTSLCVAVVVGTR